MKKLISFLLLILIPQSGFAYYTFQDTGDLLAPGEYAPGVELQFRTTNGSGNNIIGRWDGGWKDDLNWRGFVGLGKVDFQAGGLVKWVPIPDHDKQPAIGISFGGLIATYESDTELAARFNPFVSKTIEVDFGQLTPYTALPIGFRTYDDESNSTVQWTLGSRFIHPDMPGSHFFAEIGLDLDDAFTYLSVGATFPLNADYRIDIWGDH